jgi:alpha-glucosidase
MPKTAKLFTLICWLGPALLQSQTKQQYEVKSPDGNIIVHISAGKKLQWSVEHKGQTIIEPSSISLTLDNGKVLGDDARMKSAIKTSVNTSFNALNYRKAVVPDVYNQLTLSCRDDYGVNFRVYNDAVAYQFVTAQHGEIIVEDEEATFNFTDDHKAFIPIQWDYRDGMIFNSSFEALYREIRISQFPEDSLAFLPVLVDAGRNQKVEILEADLDDYPGMYLELNETGKGFRGVYAPYPLEAHKVGINLIPTKRAYYIAKTAGPRTFPWRAVVITEADRELLNCDIIQKLASPSRIQDISWIKPGQVSWDWWNAMNISHVDFRVGKNTATYRHFIDFASDNHVPYILLDAGWSVRGDISRAIPDIDLEELVAYGKQKGVGLILWISWVDAMEQRGKAFPVYSRLGIKGLKIDFIDRDDQVAVNSTSQIAKHAAEHHLLVDYHGVFKPTGLQRTYPNVVGFEGVKGMENVKWAAEDVPRYDVTLPYIRNLAGPMDYTPGAMRNSNRENFRPVNNIPMSQGTRCHQMAMYVVFEVPLQMLSDSPTLYQREQECTDFITQIPTTFDATVPLDGKVAEYVAVARRKGDTWFAGAMTNWDARELTLDFSFLDKGAYEALVFKDGVNADRDATDYKKETIKIASGDKLNISLSKGGGWAARIEKIK